MRRFVVNVPPSSADRAPIVSMIAAGVVCAAAGFFFVRWIGGPVGDDSGAAVPAIGADDDVAPGDDVGRSVPQRAAARDEPTSDDAEDRAGATTSGAARDDAGVSAVAASGRPDASATEPASASGSTTGGPTAGRVAYVRCEVGTQNADGTWPPCPRFRELELAAARAVPRLAGCPDLARAGRGFDVRILYRRGRPRPSLVVLPSSAPWAETVATCVRERFTGLPDGSGIDGNLTMAVRVELGAPAETAAPAAIEPPADPPEPTPTTPTTPTPTAPTPTPTAPTPTAPTAQGADDEPPAPPGLGPDGASADYRALARPRQATLRAGAIMRAGPRDGAVLERPRSDERIEILGFDRGWVHVRWRGRTAWVFQTWTGR